jgi:hypothetical protein
MSLLPPLKKLRLSEKSEEMAEIPTKLSANELNRFSRQNAALGKQYNDLECNQFGIKSVIPSNDYHCKIDRCGNDCKAHKDEGPYCRDERDWY